MAQKRSASKSKQKAQGGGRTPNSEPRVQDFKQFAGMNIELSPNEFDYVNTPFEDDNAQTDLMMTQFVLQNNACVESNGSISTREKIQEVAEAPSGVDLTGVCCLVNDELYVAGDDGNIYYGEIDESGEVTLDSAHIMTVTRYDPPSPLTQLEWTAIYFADDQIIALTTDDEIYTGTYGSHALANAAFVATPSAWTYSTDPLQTNITAVGMQISSTWDSNTPFRVGLGYTYVNKFGPTECSPILEIYVSTAVAEWNSGCYLSISGTAPTNKDILALEMYYTVDNASEPNFATRYDFPITALTPHGGGAYTFNFIGYLQDTSSWPMANLTAPTTNYTKGAPCQRITQIDGRFYFWGSSDYPDRLYIGGNAGNLLSISTGTGGGFVDVDPGSGKAIRVVTKYKTQSGNNIITLLCDSNNSRKEFRYNLVENTVSLSSESSMKSWEAEHVSGAVGCKSFDGAIVCEDGIYAVSRYGVALTTLTMEYNSQIRTNYVSDAIKPAFTSRLGEQLSSAILLDIDGVLFLAFGEGNGVMENVLFCYDIDKKAWYTYTLDVSDPVLKLFHWDSDEHREGIGIITDGGVYMLPTTMYDELDEIPDFNVQIESAELSTAIPMQGYQHVTQMRFFFDHFVGTMEITFVGVDQFGRRMIARKFLNYSTVQKNLTEFMRIDMRVQSYKLRFLGHAKFRLTHFASYVYVVPSRFGIVYGFDDRQSYRVESDIHPTFTDYNSIRKALIT